MNFRIVSFHKKMIKIHRELNVTAEIQIIDK